jgi:hypothetical protein
MLNEGKKFYRVSNTLAYFGERVNYGKKGFIRLVETAFNECKRKKLKELYHYVVDEKRCHPRTCTIKHFTPVINSVP